MLLEEFNDGVTAQCELTLKIRKHRWIQVAAARGHDQTLERRESQGGVQRAAALERGNRTATAELQRDKASAGGQTRIQRTPLAPERFMRKSMESVAAHSVGHPNGDRQCVFGGNSGQLRKIGGVEHSQLARIATEHLERGAHPAYRCRIVQWRERGQRLDSC